MTFQFTCTTCKKTLQSSDDKIGAKVCCPGCKTILQVPCPEAKAPNSVKGANQSEKWSYTKDGKSKIGPFSWDQLKALGQAGQIKKSDMVLHPETSKWVPASSLESLFPVQAVCQVAVAEAPPTAKPFLRAYQAAIEKGDFASSLDNLLKAIQVGGNQVAPFPVEKYQAQRILGVGGFGVAFLCKHRYMDCQVVVKTLLAEGLQEEAEKVFSEAQILNQLDHPTIIKSLDCGFMEPEAKARPFLVLEYFEGATLAEYVHKNGPLPFDEFLPLARQIGEALLAAHGKGILHRDLKPANVLVRREGQDWKLKIIDFGLAIKKKAGTGSTGKGASWTLSGDNIGGTLDYASPEQMGRLAGVPVSPKSDIFGWAKTCCFTLFKTPQPLLKHWQNLSQPFAKLLEECLAETPQERPEGFRVVLQRLGSPSAQREQAILPGCRGPESQGQEKRERLLWRRILQETWACPKAAISQVAQTVSFGRESLKGRSLSGLVLARKMALGQRMLEIGVGDPQLRQQIAVLDERVRIVQEAKGSTRPLKAERDRLVCNLASQALVAPEPGVEQDIRSVREAETTLADHQCALAKRKENLLPKGLAAWCRPLAGCLMLACLMAVPFFLFPSPSGKAPRQESEYAEGNKPREKEPENTNQENDGVRTTPRPENLPHDKLPVSEARLPEKGSLKDAQPSGISVVFSEGIGTTQDEALKDAFRTAVQRVVGVFVDSETLVKNDAIISDKVLTFSDGAIKKYEELDHSENKGLFRVKIKAAVERRTVAARLEAAHISFKVVDVKNVAEAFSKEIRADLDRLAHEITDKEAKENARKILENDLSRIAKINMIEAKVVGELERGSKVGNKLPLKVRVRYEVNEAAFHEAMSKLEKSLLMNSSSWGKITFLATPDLIMKRDNQSSIAEGLGKDNVFVLVNKGLASEKWRSHWHYYVLPADAGKLFSQRLVEKKLPNVKLSLLDKDGEVVATDDFAADNIVRAFQYNAPTNIPMDKLTKSNPKYDYHMNIDFRRCKTLIGVAQEYDIDISSVVEVSSVFSGDLQRAGDVLFRFLRSPQEPLYLTQPFNRKCYFASPCFFNLSPDIRYMTGFEQVREIPFTLDEIKLIQSVKCELFAGAESKPAAESKPETKEEKRKKKKGQ